MAYQQVCALLHHAEAYHHGAAELYDRLAGAGVSPRVAMLLAYLARHERAIEQTIARQRSEAAQGVLDTWVTTTHETDELDSLLPKAPGAPGEMTVDDVLDLALQTDDRAISVYEEVLQRGTPDSVTETFENLLDMEKNQEKRMVLQTARGDDL